MLQISITTLLPLVFWLDQHASACGVSDVGAVSRRDKMRDDCPPVDTKDVLLNAPDGSVSITVVTYDAHTLG